MEFKYGDRVRAYKTDTLGTVVDERLPQNAPWGSFEDHLPHPVAVLWDDNKTVLWENGENLELA